MHYLWINLNSSVDRREFMESQFQKYLNSDDISIRVEGVVKNRGIAGCTNAHFNAILKGKELSETLGLSSFVICEDNFEFVNKINWVKLIENAPSDWDILQLLTSNPSYASHDCKYIPYRKSHWGAKIYLVKSSSCDAIINYVNNPKIITRDADQVIFEGVKTYTLVKPIGLIKKFRSTIAPWHDKFTDKFQSKFTVNSLTEHPFWIENCYLPNGDKPLDILTAATLDE